MGGLVFAVRKDRPLPLVAFGALAIVAGVQDTDTTFAANGARALELSNPGGQVVVRVWDRDEVRVQADHSRRTYIEIDRSSDGAIEIEPDAEMGPATVVDFQITIPEIGTLKANRRPHVFLTSNQTRELHDALKRRCLYHWIDYPNPEREEEIVRTRIPEVPVSLAAKVVAAVPVLVAWSC